MTTNTLGIKIKELRKKRNLTQAELAKMIGCAQNTIAEWESTRERLPRGTFLSDVAKILGVSLNYLIDSDDKEEKTIPCYGGIETNEFVLKEKALYSIEIPSYEYQQGLFCLKIMGNFLYPIAEKEDYCIFTKREPINNDIVIVTNEKSYIKVWRQEKNLAVISSVQIDNESTIFIDVKKTKSGVQYKEKNSGTKINVEGVLVAVKRTMRVVNSYPRIKYIFS